MQPTFQVPGLLATDHTITVPLDHAQPHGQQIELFARELVAIGKQNANLPWLLFLQGGPGGKSPRPLSRSGWLKRATEEYRVLLLDQRGTGRSTPANHQTLARLGSAQAQADYLMHFRADAIVHDAELLRAYLVGNQPWSLLAQSYGGFCALTYLSFAPEGVREAFFTGGLAPVLHSPDDVYRMTYKRVLARNQAYFARYPGDQERLQAIAMHLHTHTTRLPNGECLTPRRFQFVGMHLGAAEGFEMLHYLIDEAFVDGVDGPELNASFLYEVLQSVSFAGRPIFALLHEPIYCQSQAANWSAERIRSEYPQFNWQPGKQFLFTGEMIYPWMFEEDSSLQPLHEAAQILASKHDWPALYDTQRLAECQVPCAAAVYDEDMYVERAYSDEVARLLPNCRVWVTNELQHNGLRADGERVLGRLIDMLRGVV